MKRKLLFLIACAVFVIAPALVFAGQVEGTVQGLNCASKGIACPIDKKDPVIATESTFVIITGPSAYYLVPNLDRAVMAGHVAEYVKVTGEINEKYKSIEADVLQVKKKGEWVTVWSREMEKAWEMEITGGDLGGR